MACAADEAVAPISAAEFAACMQHLGRFEARPYLAVGVSGGRDSLALVLLAAEWVAARGGRIIAVTIDHGLRTESAAEAAQVSAWMARQGISHQTLAWQDSPGPQVEDKDAIGGGTEAAARSARYALLETFCRAQGILHLLVGHHRDDQLETQAMRRARASGVFGRAGMPAVRELPHARILRPLLDIPRARVTATVRARGQDWIEDPSNRDARFARARMRIAQPTFPSTGSGAGENTALLRVVAERETARVAAQAVALHPAGFATLNPAVFDAANRETGVRLIANLVTCIGGRIYAPRGPRLIRLVDKLMAGSLGGGATLGGCTVRSDRSGMVRVARELAAIEAPRHVNGAGDVVRTLHWDGRFQILFPAAQGAGVGSMADRETLLGAVGHFSALGVPAHPDSPRYGALPHAIRMALPAISRDDYFIVCAMPFSEEMRCDVAIARFAPKNPVAGAVFATG
ncbi:MAG: tRNA lysidine(34) synthetase TilS [Proteobacteria bacterium]|nr:tRNA lysidine(34) synthetase TilS [Pseudomonadota bacterium]